MRWQHASLKLFVLFCLVFVTTGRNTSEAKPVFPGNPPFFENPNAEKLIVFIHGINGSPKTTWTHKDENFFFPKELANDAKFKNADVLSFGYESECGPSANIREIAQQLANSLEVALEKDYQSISFVAHSMGGLVVREFILSHWKKLNIPIDSVVMLSTPNGGNRLANFAKFFCDSSSLTDLEAGKDSYVDGLNDRWREQFEQPDSIKSFHFSAGYELVPVILIGLIVEKVSATIFSQQIAAFKKDHSTIAKPFGFDDPVYSWVQQRLLKKPPDPKAKSLSEAEEKQYTETIEKLQKELQGTDLEGALKLVAENQLDKALTLLSENEMKEDEAIVKTARTRFAMAQVYELKLEYRNSLKYYEKAVQLAPTNSLYLNSAGLVLVILGQYDKAIEYYEKALASGLKTFGLNHPDVATIWNNLGGAWYNKGEYDKAIEYFEKALAGGLKILGPDHPNVALTWNNLGAVWYRKGDYDKAIGYYEKALTSGLNTLGLDHPNVGLNWNNLGLAWYSKRGYDKAIGYYEKALASGLKIFGPDHPNVALSWNNMGLVWYSKGDYDKAIGYFEKALAVYEKANLPHYVKAVRKNITDLKNKR